MRYESHFYSFSEFCSARQNLAPIPVVGFNHTEGGASMLSTHLTEPQKVFVSLAQVLSKNKYHFFAQVWRRLKDLKVNRKRKTKHNNKQILVSKI